MSVVARMSYGGLMLSPNFRAFIIGDFAYGAIRKSRAVGSAYEPVRRFAVQRSKIDSARRIPDKSLRV